MLRIMLEVIAKVESLASGGSYLLHCNLTPEVEGVVPADADPLQLAIRVGSELWEAVEVGDILSLPMDSEIHRPSLAQPEDN